MIAGCRSDHTLPVTSIHCGRGVSPVVVTTSLDQTCKIYSLADGALQHTAASLQYSTPVHRPRKAQAAANVAQSMPIMREDVSMQVWPCVPKA